MSDDNKINPHTIESYNSDLNSVLGELEESHYLFIIADKKKAFIYLFNNGEVEMQKSIMDTGIRKSTKINSGELYGKSTKLSNRIDNQLRRHLQLITHEAGDLIKNMHINGLFIGGHQPLFHSIKNELDKQLQEKFRGEFVTELNIPEAELIQHCKHMLSEYSK